MLLDTKQDQLSAVTENGCVIGHISDPDVELQLAAVTQNGYAIQYIKSPSADIKFKALTQTYEYTGFAILTEDEQFAEMKHKYPSHIANIYCPTEKVQIATVTDMGTTIRFLPNASDAVKIAAIGECGSSAFRHMHNPSYDVIMAAIARDPASLYNIANPTEEMKLLAVSNDGWIIECIESPSVEMQLAAVNNDPYTICCIAKPALEVVLTASK